MFVLIVLPFLCDQNEALKGELENAQESLQRVLNEKESLDDELKRMEQILGIKNFRRN